MTIKNTLPAIIISAAGLMTAAEVFAAPPANVKGVASGVYANIVADTTGGRYSCKYTLTWQTADGKSRSANGQIDVSGTAKNAIVVQRGSGRTVKPGSVTVEKWRCKASS